MPPAWVVALAGEHDASTTDEVDRVLTAAVASGDPVIVDLQSATFADSSILGAIIRAEKAAGRNGLAVVLPGDGEVWRLFDLVDARAMLVTFPTLREAVDWCYRAGEANGHVADEV
ncbi:MAG TPA: STAS domain-containing protein [Gaiellales bacterium]|nr:STAS domain-containing protein [Gaiellales bacterium]